jgi:hypothetical protein
VLGSNSQRLFDPEHEREKTRRWGMVAQEDNIGEGLESVVKL